MKPFLDSLEEHKIILCMNVGAAINVERESGGKSEGDAAFPLSKNPIVEMQIQREFRRR